MTSAQPGCADNEPPSRILLLTILPIGDTLLVTPTMQALRDRYPSAHITALARADTESIVRCVPAIDEVVVWPFGADWAGVYPLARALRLLRAQRYDVSIDFTTPAYKWINFAAGIPLRTYMKFDPLWWIVPGSHQRWRSTHATRHFYDCARELDLPPWEAVSHVPHLELPAAERAGAEMFLRRLGVGRDQCPLVGIHAGGAWLGGLKRWPPERFAGLADRLCEEWDARILLLGSRGEAPLAATVAAAMRHTPIIATGAVPLLTSLAVIAACDLFVGDDSGLLHAAAALGTPYVGIFGPTWPANFQPVAAHPGQGTLLLPSPPCCTPRYFVGGSPLWDRPCCRGACRALTTIDVRAAFTAADGLLRRSPALRSRWPDGMKRIPLSGMGSDDALEARGHSRR